MQCSAYLLTHILNSSEGSHNLGFLASLPLCLCPPLQVMWTHLEQRSFPMSEEEYDEKLELIALYLK
jgi:hypothetical protein